MFISVTRNAVQSLKTLEALDQWEEVTVLGSHLLDIPLGTGQDRTGQDRSGSVQDRVQDRTGYRIGQGTGQDRIVTCQSLDNNRMFSIKL